MSKITIFNKARAQELMRLVNIEADAVHKHGTKAGEYLLEFRQNEGWTFLGHADFKTACEKELKDYGSRQHIYRLMQQAEVNASVSPAGDTVIPTMQTRELGKLEPTEQADAYEEATRESGGAPTTAAVKKSVAKRQQDVKKKPNPKASNDKYEKALERVSKIISKKIRENIEKGILKIPEKEVIFWASLTDAEMADIQELVVSARWQPSKAHKFINKMVTGATKVEELINLAIANGGEWDGTVSGYTITVKATRRK